MIITTHEQWHSFDWNLVIFNYEITMACFISHFPALVPYFKNRIGVHCTVFENRQKCRIWIFQFGIFRHFLQALGFQKLAKMN